MSQYTPSSQNNDKSEPMTKEEWQSRLEHFEIKRADMNKLIMNYLVTGKCQYLQIIDFFFTFYLPK